MKKLGFGLMRLPMLNEKEIDVEQTKKMVDIFLERGFTYFDTAYMYLDYKSEIVAREALVNRYPRDKFTLTTKLPISMLKCKEDMERIFNEQLQKCGVDFFDYYLLHNLGTKNYETAQKYNAFEFAMNKKKEGKIKTLGFSFHDKADVLDRILTEHPEVEFVQLQINYLDWEDEIIQSKKCCEVARKHNKPIIVMEPVKGGTLANIPNEAESLFKKYNSTASAPSWAVRYTASLDGVFMVLSGMSNIAQLKDNTDYMIDFKPLNETEKEIILKATEVIMDSKKIPCTTCRYCTQNCPKDIAIPDYFMLYNSSVEERNENIDVQKGKYSKICKTHGKGSDCIECHNCEGLCPQHIKITEMLKEITKSFE